MKHLVRYPEVRAALEPHRKAGRRIAFVPTMGNLHAGHMALVTRARELCDTVVVSIFVNPIQFDRTEDLAAYPRTLDADAGRLEAAGVDVLYVPDEAEVYPRGREQGTRVVVPGLSDILEGAHRPGHFAGVATVVCKLFNRVRPDLAVFGEKDWQQLRLIRRMVEDLDMGIEIVGLPTVREPDGLAMSSRNGALTAEERVRAPALYWALDALRQALLAGRRDFDALEIAACAALAAGGMHPEYVSVRSRDLGDPGGARDLVVLGAARLGRTRLIDSIPLRLP